jgi:NAD(P)-dependent dehydrogenase (short-subunit alcohol dehydrogenase family)
MSPVAIVTASDSEMGQEWARELAEYGFDVPFQLYKRL